MATTTTTTSSAPPSFLTTGSKTKKLIKEGILYAELHSLLQRELPDTYCGCEVRTSPTRIQVIINATNTTKVLGTNGQSVRELTSLVEKRFGFTKPGTIQIFANRLEFKGLSAIAQAESLKYKLARGLPIRRACYRILRNAMESGAKGAEVIVSGKLRAARAKSMKFTEGYLVRSGQPMKMFVEVAVRSVKMRQGVLGIKVKIMKPYDPRGIMGPRQPLPDAVTIVDPKEEGRLPTAQAYAAAGTPAPTAPGGSRFRPPRGDRGDRDQPPTPGATLATPTPTGPGSAPSAGGRPSGGAAPSGTAAPSPAVVAAAVAATPTGSTSGRQ